MMWRLCWLLLFVSVGASNHLSSYRRSPERAKRHQNEAHPSAVIPEPSEPSNVLVKSASKGEIKEIISDEEIEQLLVTEMESMEDDLEAILQDIHSLLESLKAHQSATVRNAITSKPKGLQDVTLKQKIKSKKIPHLNPVDSKPKTKVAVKNVDQNDVELSDSSNIDANGVLGYTTGRSGKIVSQQTAVNNDITPPYPIIKKSVPYPVKNSSAPYPRKIVSSVPPRIARRAQQNFAKPLQNLKSKERKHAVKIDRHSEIHREKRQLLNLLPHAFKGVNEVVESVGKLNPFDGLLNPKSEPSANIVKRNAPNYKRHAFKKAVKL